MIVNIAMMFPWGSVEGHMLKVGGLIVIDFDNGEDDDGHTVV